MPGNESVTDNMKSFVGGVALKQAFYNIKTYNEQAISTAITTHNADAAHRHLPIAPTAATTAASGLASLNFLTNSLTPEWKKLPLATGYTTNSDDTLATGKAVKTAYDTLNTSLNAIPKIQRGYKQVTKTSDSQFGNQPVAFATGSVTFSPAFNTVPTVIVAADDLDSGLFAAEVEGNTVSRTGFNFSVFGGTVSKYAVHWIAIGT